MVATMIRLYWCDGLNLTAVPSVSETYTLQTQPPDEDLLSIWHEMLKHNNSSILSQLILISKKGYKNDTGTNPSLWQPAEAPLKGLEQLEILNTFATANHQVMLGFWSFQIRTIHSSIARSTWSTNTKQNLNSTLSWIRLASFGIFWILQEPSFNWFKMNMV